MVSDVNLHPYSEDDAMGEAMRSALNALLYRTGSQSTAFCLVLASNRPEDLDEAVLDRMDELVEFPLPGVEQRARILKQHLDAARRHTAGRRRRCVGKLKSTHTHIHTPIIFSSNFVCYACRQTDRARQSQREPEREREEYPFQAIGFVLNVKPLRPYYAALGEGSKGAGRRRRALADTSAATPQVLGRAAALAEGFSGRELAKVAAGVQAVVYAQAEAGSAPKLSAEDLLKAGGGVINHPGLREITGFKL